MMQVLKTGQKIKADTLWREGKLVVEAMAKLPGQVVDIVCFGVDEAEQLSDERYFVFYNQLQTPEGAVTLDGERFSVDLLRLPEKINKLVFAAAIDGDATMSCLEAAEVTLSGDDTAVYRLTGADFALEKAIILLEIYRKDNIWRLAMVGRGFNGGLSALLAHFGGEEEKPAPQVSLTKGEQVSKIVLEKAPRLVDLTKKAVVTLEKKKLDTVTAKVLLVLDASGSMNHQYRNGRVQRLLDKVLPLAMLFDDDQTLESWAFATKCRQLTDTTIDNIDHYIDQANGGWRKWDIGGVNNEPAVMEAIWQRHKNSALPVYVLFISDGGVSKNTQIRKLIIEAAQGPLFWQFVGIGGKNYGALEKLDELSGRVVDNANFFALDDIDDLSDEALYDRLMNEFPLWLKAAREKGILR